VEKIWLIEMAQCWLQLAQQAEKKLLATENALGEG
jgi:hypothetical protein